MRKLSISSPWVAEYMSTSTPAMTYECNDKSSESGSSDILSILYRISFHCFSSDIGINRFYSNAIDLAMSQKCGSIRQKVCLKNEKNDGIVLLLKPYAKQFISMWEIKKLN